MDHSAGARAAVQGDHALTKRPQPVEIFPVSESYRKLLAKGVRIRPKNSGRMAVDQDLYEGIQKIAMSMFADCCNAGMPFQEALTYVYMSGLEHATSIHQEE